MKQNCIQKIFPILARLFDEYGAYVVTPNSA